MARPRQMARPPEILRGVSRLLPARLGDHDIPEEITRQLDNLPEFRTSHRWQVHSIKIAVLYLDINERWEATRAVSSSEKPLSPAHSRSEIGQPTCARPPGEVARKGG
jgi:hypothetical protein